MKRLATIALALLAVTSAAGSRKPPKGITLPRGCRDRGCVRERTVSDGATCSQSIQCAVTAGDKSGSWWAIRADGTMLSGSALTMTAAGSPGVSPLSFNGVDQKYTSGNVAYPAGSFSFVAVFNVNPSTSASTEVVSKWEGANLSFTLEMGGTGSVTPNWYVIAAGGATGRAIGVDIVKGIWFCMGGMYTTGTGDVTLRQYGIGNASATATGGGVFAQTTPHRVAAYSAGGFFWGLSRGVFFTEKVLSDADVDRICAGAL